MQEANTLPCMTSHFDGAHCGLGDWYPQIEQGIQYALRCISADGPVPFTTGWYSSKKEIASARISRVGVIICVEVSVSDDFDTVGTASENISNTTDLEAIRDSIYRTWDAALEDKRDNEMYAGWIIGHRSGANNRGRKRTDWIETYISNTHDLDEPPGDNYHKWGWQEETDEIPKDIRAELQKKINAYESPAFAGDFMAELWSD